jgi:hypothetical protein
MPHNKTLQLRDIEGEAEDGEVNLSHTFIEFEHADSLLRREKAHGKIEIIYVNGEADLLRREVNIKLPRGRAKPSLA